MRRGPTLADVMSSQRLGARVRTRWFSSRRPGVAVPLCAAWLAAASAVNAAPPARAASHRCGPVAVSGKPRTEVLVEIGSITCARARSVIEYALGHVRPGGVAVTFRGPRGWECTRGVFPLQPSQHGARYDTAHSMSCAAPPDTAHVKTMIAGFFGT